MKKIIHLSDLHMGKGKRRIARIKPLEELVLTQLSEQAPDAIVISGDLTNKGMLEDFARVSTFLDRLRELCPVLYVPGNTDYTPYLYGDERQEQPETRDKFTIKKKTILKEPLFLDPEEEGKLRYTGYGLTKRGQGDYYIMEVVEGGEGIYKDPRTYFDFCGSNMEPTLELGEVNLIGIDSYRDVQAKVVGTVEEVGSDQKYILIQPIDGRILSPHLDERLKDLPEGNNIAVMHHPIFSIPGSNPLGGIFEDGKDVAKALGARGINLSLCGHKHIPGHSSKKIKGNKFYVAAAGTLFSRDIKKPHKDNSYNSILIQGNTASIFRKNLHSDKVHHLVNVKLS